MNTEALHIASGNSFGVRLSKNRAAKEKIAQKVVKDILLRDGFDPRNPVFFSDGSSASVAFWHFMNAYLAGSYDDVLNVCTNNIDIAMQYVCHPPAADKIVLELAPGTVRAEYCGVYGRDTDEWIAQYCDCTCVMAVTGLDAEFGPTAKYRDAMRRKVAIMRSARQLVILADSAKLSYRRDIANAVSPNEWNRWCEDRTGRLHVVSDRTAGIEWPPTKPYVLGPGMVDRRAPDQIEQENHRLLKLKLKDRYIVV